MPLIVLVGILVGACGTAQPGGPVISDLETPAAALMGAGSTFDQPFFARAFSRYHQLNPQVTVQYAAQGSSFGIQAFQARSVDFGASDVPMTSDEMAQATGGPVLQVPVALGGEAISYNLNGVGAGMHLTGTVLANIYLGRITRWDDPAITNLNPDLTLPDEPITVVHRSDGSGTTYIFTDFLSDVSPAWAGGPGKGKSISWPTGVGASGNQGVADAVRSIRGAIGYVELAYAPEQLHLRPDPQQQRLLRPASRRHRGHGCRPEAERIGCGLLDRRRAGIAELSHQRLQLGPGLPAPGRRRERRGGGQDARLDYRERWPGAGGCNRLRATLDRRQPTRPVDPDQGD